MIFEQHVEELFRAAHPKAVDVSMADYRREEEMINSWASLFGYRFAGERLGRAVFTTKPEPTKPERGG